MSSKKKSALCSHMTKIIADGKTPAPVAPELTGDQAYEQLDDILRQLDDRIRQAQRRVDDLYQQHQQAEEFLAFETDKAKTLRAKIGAADELLVAMPFDADLRKALLAKKVYANAIKNGATDKELIQLLSGEGRLNYYSSPFETGRDEDQPVIYSYRNHRRVSPPILTGQDEILGTVRRVLSIPQPIAKAKPPLITKPAPKPAAAKPSTKSTKITKPAKAKPEERAAANSAKSKPAAKPKPAKEKDDGFGNITGLKLVQQGDGYVLKYRKGTHTKTLTIVDGYGNPMQARDAAIAAFNKKENLEYPAASIGMPEDSPVEHSKTEAPSNADQSPVDPASDGAADLSSDAVTVDLSGEERIFLTNGRWRLWCSDQKLDDPCTEAILLDATTQDEAIKEAAAFMGVPADKIVLIDAPAQAEVSS